MTRWRRWKRGGEAKSLAVQLELMLITIGSRYPVSDCYQQPIRRLIQLVYRLKEHQENAHV